MALLISCITQHRPVRDCISFPFYLRILFTLSKDPSALARLKHGTGKIMESLQGNLCCKLALRLYGVRRRGGAIPDCEGSFGE